MELSSGSGELSLGPSHTFSSSVVVALSGNRLPAVAEPRSRSEEDPVTAPLTGDRAGQDAHL